MSVLLNGGGGGNNESNRIPDLSKEKKNGKEEDDNEISNLESKYDEKYPDNRTVLVLNFKTRLDVGFIKKVFSTMGKIREVVSGEVKRNSGRKLYYNVVVFKHENDMIRAFDIRMFYNFMSRWTIFLLCRYAMAFNISFIITLALD